MEKIQSPIQVIDEARCRANIQVMHTKALKSGCTLRPHFKTHQSLEVGSWFRDEGVSRIAVSSVAMANFFARDGWKDIMIAFPVNIREIDQINNLAREVQLGLLITSRGVVSLLDKLLSHPVDIYFKVDVGTHRTGFHPDDIKGMEEETDMLHGHPMMRFRGFVAHAGHTYQAASAHEIRKIYHDGTRVLQTLKERFRGRFPGIMISWGDTPSCSLMNSFEGIDEIRPGNFVFYDLMQWKIGACTLEEISMVVATPVVALHPERNEVVVYGGAVHLSKEQLLLPDGQISYGMMVSMEENGQWELLSHQVMLRRLSQEHGILNLPPEMNGTLAIGQLVGILPVHSCLAADLLKENPLFI